MRGVLFLALAISSARHPQARCVHVPGAKGLIHIACTNLTIDEFADYLQDLAPVYIDRPVVNETAIRGTYDFALDWAPQDAGTADPVPGPTIFGVLEKRYGLELQRRNRPVPTLVVVHIDRIPTEN